MPRKLHKHLNSLSAFTSVSVASTGLLSKTQFSICSHNQERIQVYAHQDQSAWFELRSVCCEPSCGKLHYLPLTYRSKKQKLPQLESGDLEREALPEKGRDKSPEKQVAASPKKERVLSPRKRRVPSPTVQKDSPPVQPVATPSARYIKTVFFLLISRQLID